MSDATWTADVDRLLALAKADEHIVEHLATRLDEDQRKILGAILASRGEPRALVERLGPVLVRKVKVGRIHAPAAGENAWRFLRIPLKAAWTPPRTADPQKIAIAFLDRYAARLDELTEAGARAGSAAASLAHALRALGGSKDMVKLVEDIRSSVARVQAAAAGCGHAGADRLRWAEDAAHLARTSADAADQVRRLRDSVAGMAKVADDLAASLRRWAEAPPAARAATAASMAARFRAAGDAARAMREEFAQFVADAAL